MLYYPQMNADKVVLSCLLVTDTTKPSALLVVQQVNALISCQASYKII